MSTLEKILPIAATATNTERGSKPISTRFSQNEMLPLKNDVGALLNRINLRTRVVHHQINKMMTLRFALLLRDYKIYRQGVQMYYHVFSAIEYCLEREFNNPESEWGPLLKEIWHPAVARREALYQDLMFFYDNDESRFNKPVLEEQIKYIEYIKKSTQEKPYLLLAYMHVLYLALFAGGQIFKSDIAKATGFYPKVKGRTHEEVLLYGTNLLRFDQVEDPESLRIHYKRNYELNTRNALTEEQKKDVIEESYHVFVQNGVLIKEIETRNIQRLKSKLSYKAAVGGFYLLYVLVLLLLLYSGGRFLLHFTSK